MHKHAYLIMAHGSWGILEKLLRLLDAEYNDFYLHIDVKAKNVPDITAWLSHSKLRFIEPTDVRWADYSQSNVELRLLDAALCHGGYSYFHLLSGVDLPLKPAREIYDFFESSGKNFLGFDENHPCLKWSKTYHPLVELPVYRKHKAFKAVDRAMHYAQLAVGVNRHRRCDWTVMHGFNWFSIREEAASCVIAHEDKLTKMFEKTIGSDEMFLQTVFYNCGLMDTLYDRDVYRGCVRSIDWKRGTPYVWGSTPGKEDDDFRELTESPNLFARKFDERHMEIVDRIYHTLSAAE